MAIDKRDINAIYYYAYLFIEEEELNEDACLYKNTADKSDVDALTMYIKMITKKLLFTLNSIH